MPKQLTDTQRAFIDKYVTHKTDKQKARITKQYQDFDRRRGKVEAELATLPADHPDLPLLRGQLAAADAKAKGPDDGSAPAFDAAYKDLDAVKSGARAVAKGYKKALTPATVTVRLEAIASGLASIDQILDTNRQAMADVVAEVKAVPVPTVFKEEESAAFQQSLTKRQARWLGEADMCRTMAGVAAGLVTAMGAEMMVKAAQHDLAQIKAGGDKNAIAAAGPLEQRLAALEARAKPGGSYRTAGAVMAEFAGQEKELATAMQALRDVSPFSTVQDREKAILDRAVEAYRAAQATDEEALDPKLMRAPAPKGPPAMGKFVTGDVIGPGIAALEEDHIDDTVVTNAVKRVKTKTAAFIAAEAANSDKLFDLTMRGLNELRVEVGALLGQDGPVATWPPNTRRLAEAAAVAIKEAVAANSPNKLSDTKVTCRWEDVDHEVPDSVTQNGITYNTPEIIGQGGLGLITRYQGPVRDGQPTTIVMKSTSDKSSDAFWEPKGINRDAPDAVYKRSEMVSEMRVHRALMGGENGTPNPNVVALKGTAVGSDGSLHMIMEEAQAGDANNFSHSVAAMTRAGMLPKAAQQALQQDTMLQAVRGLKAMHDLGVLHNDIKALNYFVDIDGTVKVADFGSGDTMEDGADERVRVPSTTYDAPEFNKGTRTEKSDIYALGAMLHGMDAEHGIEGMRGELGAGPAGRGAGFGIRARTDQTATSLDRLRNAMMAVDPNDRPTLEGILMSSYLNDARDQYDGGGSTPAPSPLAALRKAMAAYSKEVGRELGTSAEKINQTQGEIIALLKKDMDPDQLRQQIEAKQKLIDDEQAKIDAINARPTVAPLLQAIKDAGAAFGTAKGDEQDNAWDFAYRKTMEGLDRATGRRTPPNLPDDLAASLQNPDPQRVPAQ